mgnify:CR=1 FL=1|jgi:hypothetical protein
MKMAVWIKVDGTALTVSLPKDTTEAMLFIQKCVGGYYTPIPLKGGKVMLVNEEGIPRKLPKNPTASAIAAAGEFTQMFPDSINEHTLANKTGSSILGDVLIVDFKELE